LWFGTTAFCFNTQEADINRSAYVYCRIWKIDTSKVRLIPINQSIEALFSESIVLALIE